MSDRAELLAIFKNHTAAVEAIEGIAGTVSLTCFTLKDQGESGLEVRRLLGRFLEKNCDDEIRLIDFLRGFGSEPPMSDKERRDYRLKRSEDVMDLIDAAIETINDYVHGRAALTSPTLS